MLGLSKARLPFPSKVPWRVTAPGPAGLGAGWSTQPSSDVVSTAAESGSCYTFLHQSAAPVSLLFSWGFDTKMLLCFVLPQHLLKNVCLSCYPENQWHTSKALGLGAFM